MAPRRRYSDKFRAGAVELVNASTKTTLDGKLEEVASHLKMPKNTLRNWVVDGVNPVDEETRAEVRQELDKLFENEIQEIFQEMRAARRDAPYRDLAVALGILVDKRQLLNGGATQNVSQQITFVRGGISTIPEHLARGATTDDSGTQAV